MQQELKKPSPVDLVVQKFGGGLKWANVIIIRDIFKIAAAYDDSYTLENIENITVAEDEWITVTINGKTFQLIYYSYSCGGTYLFRVDGKSCKMKQVAEYLVGGFDPKAERFKSYRKLYFAIRDNVPDAFELYKAAVKGMDWSYMMSEDPSVYRGGRWQEKALKELGKMLGSNAEQHYQDEHDKYWNRVNSN